MNDNEFLEWHCDDNTALFDSLPEKCDWCGSPNMVFSHDTRVYEHRDSEVRYHVRHVGKCLRCSKTVYFHRKKRGEKPYRRPKKTPPVEKGKCIADTIRNYMNYAFDRLQISNETREYGNKFYTDNIRGNEGLSGKNPRVIAAALCYIACVRKGDPHTQTQIADSLNVASIALRNMTKLIRPSLHQRYLSLME
jgi:transcription factor TFIIB-like protein